MGKYRVKVCIGETCSSKSVKSDTDPIKDAKPVYVLFGGIKVGNKSVLVPLSEVDEKALELADVDPEEIEVEVYEIKEKKGKAVKLSELGK